ncbi:MAG: T9SS type A sorting domain-containing protein, partial [bacterium]
VDFKWGAEPVTIKWTFNGELIQEGVWDKFNGDKLLTLMLESINENQAGEYICLLENECAKTEVKFKLTVTKWDEAGISDVVSENGYSLFTAVPNPTNEIATVKYIMPKAGSVKFTLSDLSGRVIRNLFEDFAAEGMNQLQINVKQLGLPAGVYFYTMTSDNFSAVRSFVVE